MELPHSLKQELEKLPENHRLRIEIEALLKRFTEKASTIL